MVRLRVASGISLYDLFQNFFLKEDLGLVSGGDWRLIVEVGLYYREIMIMCWNFSLNLNILVSLRNEGI